jgi:hypothetical protein
VFDPERDEDTDRRRFYGRLLAIAVISAAGCLALWPSVTGFAGGPDHQIGCLAVKDAWTSGPSAPNDAAVKAAFADYPPMPTEAQRNDPAFMATFRARIQALQALPIVQQATDYANWVSQAGACVRESRHRLMRSGVGLLGLVGFCAGVAYFRRTRKNPHQPPQELAGI